ncbi:MAG: aldo/keto reductase [Actinomycetota bacterium]
MRTNQLGPGGPFVSELGLGTMTFGAETGEADAHLQLDRFLEVGGTLVDTADGYAGGESERIVGRWLADRRPEHVILTTKGRFSPPPGSSGASRRGITRAIDASLDRLGVDVIDLYLVHGWDADAPVEDTLGALTDAVRAGKIHHVGWSNTTAWQFQRILDSARHGGFVRPVVHQPQYNLVDRGIEWELLPLLLDEGVAVTPWSPLAGGWLTGKYRRDEHPTGETRLGEDPQRGVEAWDVRNDDRVWAIIDTAAEIAEETGRWMGEVALRWLLQRPGTASVLLGARTVAQLDQSLAAVDGDPLTVEQMERLTSVSAPGLPPYPYGMIRDFTGIDVWDRLGTAGPISG